MGNNFSSKYELFRNVKADDKKGLNKNYGIFLVLRRKTGMQKKNIFMFLLCMMYRKQKLQGGYIAEELRHSRLTMWGRNSILLSIKEYVSNEHDYF